MSKEKFVKPEYDPDMNPVDYFNINLSWTEVMKMFPKVKVIDENNFFCPKNSSETRKTADFSVNGDGNIRVNHENGYNLPVGKKYTKFMIYTRIKHRGNYKSAITEIEHERLGKHIPYVRVGCDYFKVIEKSDRYGISGIELKGWKKDEIKQDHGKDSLMHVKTYDDFCIIPDNKRKIKIKDGTWNMYNEFRHKPKQGDLKWTNILMDHVFGDQINLGWRYLKLLYEHPSRYAPILVLVSKARETGKSTFLNWLNMIFGGNMVTITATDLEGSFNHIYATANIIAVEETFIEKKQIVEKLKALSTQKEIVVNQKFVSNYKIPFYGKFILASNNEDKFAIVDEEEIRFFVRKLHEAKIKNYNIENDLINEIPALLHYLESLPDIDFSVSRTGFTSLELKNENLNRVVAESKSQLYKELKIIIGDYINNLPETETEFYATAKDIKQKFFDYNNSISSSYIGRVLKEDFKMEPVNETGTVMRYNSIVKVGDSVFTTKVGNPFIFTKDIWGGKMIENQTITTPDDDDLPYPF